MAENDNIVVVTYEEGKPIAVTRPLHQYDYGMKLKLKDFPNLPNMYEMHFSNNHDSGKSYTVVGDSTGVDIPDVCLSEGRHIWAWLFNHVGPNDGETKYAILIPVIRRSKVGEEDIPEEQQDLLTDAIAKVTAIAENLDGLRNLAEMLESGHIIFDDGEAEDIDLSGELDLEVDDGL